jgi:hypothetical protein
MSTALDLITDLQRLVAVYGGTKPVYLVDEDGTRHALTLAPAVGASREGIYFALRPADVASEVRRG